MKKVLVVASPLVLGLVSGIALVVSCNSSSTSSAQATSNVHSVLDSAGNILGTLLGTGPGFSSSFNNNGTSTAVPFFAIVEMHTFLDGSNRIWSVGGDGTIFQPEASVYYAAAGCTGAPYVANGDPKVVTKYAGTYYLRSGTATTLTPTSYHPAGSPSGTCETYPPSGTTQTTVSALPASSLVAVTPPTIVPPVTIN